MFSRLKPVFVLIAVIFLGLLGIGIYNSRRFHLEKETRFMMGTYVTIYASDLKRTPSRAIGLALDRMREIDAKFSYFNPTSPIYAFNNSGTPISDPEILKLIRIALNVSQKTKGALDITVAPLLELWGFYDNSFRVPQGQAIKDCLGKVGYQHLLLEDNNLKKDIESVKIDLGGIAKGYALSEAIKVLKAQGVKSALIDMGGDIYALGNKGNKPWKVGIKNPLGGGVLGYIEVEDIAVISSGDYESFFIKDGTRYSHIFDPSTGYPTQGVASVTLIYDDPTLAQIWAKIPFVIGPKKALEMLEEIPRMEAIVITTSGDKIYSSGLKHAIHVIEEKK